MSRTQVADKYGYNTAITPVTGATDEQRLMIVSEVARHFARSHVSLVGSQVLAYIVRYGATWSEDDQEFLEGLRRRGLVSQWTVPFEGMQ